MKKTITIAALLFTSIGITKAQSNENDTRDQLHIGAKIGANYANVYDTKGEDFEADAKLGFVGGAFIAIPIGTFLGIHPEVLYSQKGFEGKGRILGSDYSFKRTTTYLDIPLFLAIKPSEFITILAGPQFSYLLSKKDVFANAYGTVEQVNEFENENYRKNTLGASIGVDINVNFFTLGFRANWDLQENNGDGSSTTPRYKNQWLQATVGLRL